MFNIRNLIPFTIIGGAVFLILYLFFPHYNLPYRIATSVVAGVIYAFIVSALGKAFFNRVIEKLVEKHQKEE